MRAVWCDDARGSFCNDFFPSAQSEAKRNGFGWNVDSIAWIDSLGYDTTIIVIFMMDYLLEYYTTALGALPTRANAGDPSLCEFGQTRRYPVRAFVKEKLTRRLVKVRRELRHSLASDELVLITVRV